MTLAELQSARTHALNNAESMVTGAERRRGPMTSSETNIYDTNMRAVKDYDGRIAEAKAKAKPKTAAEMRQMLQNTPGYEERLELRTGNGKERLIPERFSREYMDAFTSYLGGSGPLSASLGEGSGVTGGYAVPIYVDRQVVPLAPTDTAVRRLATVIPTRSDIKVPQVTARATVLAKAEGSGFPTATQTLGGFTLSAFAAGVETQASIEIAQDIDLLHAFVLDDAASAFLEYESSLWVSGSGNGQPQGLIGNVGTGVTEEPDGNGNLVSIQGTLDILGKLKASYHENATWVMSRATSLIIRKAQVGSNLYEPVWRRENGVDTLHGYRVEYESNMATAARGATPILFGDFAKGYVIGDRGGSALIAKVLDQANFASGLIDLLLFRRTDGRVRVPEAIQSYTIAAS